MKAVALRIANEVSYVTGIEQLLKKHSDSRLS